MSILDQPQPVVVYRRCTNEQRMTLFGLAASILFVAGMFFGTFLTTAGQMEIETSNEVVSETLALPAHTEQKITVAETKDETPDYDWTPDVNLEKEELCLALNIYFEAKSEPIKGKMAVALTPISRAKVDEFPDTICNVVWQKRRHPRTGKWVAQFTWTLDGKPDEPRNQRQWTEAQNMASAIFSEGSNGWHIVDFTNGATHYHANYVDPWWRNKLPYLTKVGAHLFYGSEENEL